MNILTVDNKTFSMNDLPEEIEDDFQFCVIDYTDTKNIDYQFIPLLFLESFNMPAMDIKIGPYRIQAPADWSIIIGDKHSGELEVIELKKLADRTFQAFCFNPISGFLPEFHDIEIMNIFPDIKWFVPKLRFGYLLSVPLSIRDNSLCVFLVKDANKLPEQLDITSLV